MAVIINQSACIGCKACLQACPVEALHIDEQGKSSCDSLICLDCAACIPACPISVISR